MLMVLLLIGDGIGIARAPSAVTVGALIVGGLIGGSSILFLSSNRAIKLGLTVMLAVYVLYVLYALNATS